MKPRLLKRYCVLGILARELLEQALAKLGLPVRAGGRTVRIARTIATLQTLIRLSRRI
ncbi:MAG: hypothetical protein ITD36_04580 [Nitrospira sp.]|nr:hypothetical protein [Nitrospira sp.]MBP0123847.1 hypothetical protein [Nitrospira sp.]MBP0130885.1 hypothetical protein [Nitrospira sp.]